MILNVYILAETPIKPKQSVEEFLVACKPLSRFRDLSVT